MKIKLIPTVGLMSGTSMDGIDCSLVYTDGNIIERTGYNIIIPYQNETIKALEEAYQNPLYFIKNSKKKNALNNSITKDHARAVHNLIKSSSINPKLIGFHGQTIIHNPKKKVSIQLGNGHLLQNIFNCDVVYDFRKKDLFYGGEGAPLAPIYHKQLIKDLNFDLPACIINIGGISNLSYWDGKTLFGFDTGPGNGLMDKYMKEFYSISYDCSGKVAAKGSINFSLVSKYCENTFFYKKPPKSLDIKDLYNHSFWKTLNRLSPNDAMATLCYITAKSIQINLSLLPTNPKTILIIGGGQNNLTLIQMLKNLMPNQIKTGEDVNINSNFVEAELMAYLAARRLFNLPVTFPSTTGIRLPSTAGILLKI